jgi:hypothetical protein
MIVAHSYLTWAGDLRVAIAHSPAGTKAINGMPGTRTTMLDESEARELLTQLQRALATPPECIDCGSTDHTVDDPRCPANPEG